MDGLFHGKPYFLMDDLGGKNTPIFGNSHMKPDGSENEIPWQSSTKFKAGIGDLQ